MDKHTLYILPDEIAPAAENMTDDMLLLDEFPYAEAVRFRHYKWSSPTHTFGYSQRWQDICDKTDNEHATRRPTGGGIVDHSYDWTYSLVIPPTHTLYREKATLSYLLIHETLALSLEACGCPVTLLPRKIEESSDTNGQKKMMTCFLEPVIHDIMATEASSKIAGAAQKRNRNGLLIQGSIKKDLAKSINWDELKTNFIKQLSEKLLCDAVDMERPTYPIDIQKEHVLRFESETWNRRR